MNEDLRKMIEMVEIEHFKENEAKQLLDKILYSKDLKFTYTTIDLYSKCCLIYLANTCKSKETLEKMLLVNDTSDNLIRYALLENPNTPVYILEKIKSRAEAEKSRLEELISTVDVAIKVAGVSKWLKDDIDD